MSVSGNGALTISKVVSFDVAPVLGFRHVARTSAVRNLQLLTVIGGTLGMSRRFRLSPRDLAMAA